MNIKWTSISLLFILAVSLLYGCSGEESWKPSETFIHDHLTLYGVEGTFGMVKVNGEADEPAFLVGQGRQYDLFFLDDSKEFSGATYKMMAIHQGTEEAVQLYEGEIANNRSGAKLFFDQAGVWEISVTVDERPFASFIVKADEK